VLTYDPTAGTHISEACEEAVKLARDSDQPVQFPFNGIDVIAYTKDEPSDVELRWHVESERRHREYEASPEYAASQAKRRLEVAQRQQQVDRLVSPDNFPSSEHGWMTWASELAECADDIGVTFNRELLVSRLKCAGWKQNNHVTTDPILRRRIETEPTIMAEYIMGQVMGCLDQGMPPHPMTMTFVERYMAIEKMETV